MRRTILLTALGASTLFVMATRARAEVHRNADGLAISTQVCRGVVHITGEEDGYAGFLKVGECYVANDPAQKEVHAVCHIGDTCQFRARIVGLSGWFVKRVIGPVRAIGPVKPLHKFICPGHGFCN